MTAKDKKEYTAFLNKLDIDHFLCYIFFVHYYNFHGELQSMEKALKTDVFKEEFLKFISKKPMSFLEEALKLMQEELEKHFNEERVTENYPVLVSHILFKKLNENNKKEYQVLRHSKI